MPDPLPQLAPQGQEAATILLETVALLRFQTHHWFHCRSCFKPNTPNAKSRLVSYVFPKRVCTATRWLPDDSVENKRKVGCEYLNAYAPILARVFKCNHDLKFLTAGEGPEKAFHMIKYATKPQNTLKNPLAIYTHAFDKASKRAENSESSIVTGKRCIQ